MSIVSETCLDCIYRKEGVLTKRYGFSVTCPQEGQARDIYGNPLYTINDNEECRYYTCGIGAAHAVEALMDFWEVGDSAITLEIDGRKTIPFGSPHKPFDLVQRYVSVDEPHNVWHLVNGNFEKQSDLVTRKIQASLRNFNKPD